MRAKKMTLNAYLKEKRVASGLSQSEVASELGYTSPQFVSNWERGLVRPPLETLSVLTDLYKISKNEVIEMILDETRSELESALKGKSKKRK